MRCPNCNKFVSYDDPQCEVDSVEIEGDSVRAVVSVQLNCVDCGTTLKDAQIESESQIDHECENSKSEKEFEIESDGSPEGTSRVQQIDRRGKPIKSSRYMKTFYGFEMTTEVKCLKCDEVISVSLEGEEQASGFNECC